MGFDATQLAARIDTLRAEHASAVAERDQWAARAAELERGIHDALRLVAFKLRDKVTQVEAIRAAIPALDRVFTPSDVRARLPEELRGLSTINISAVLIRMTQRGELRLFERGSGQRQSRYERTDLPEEGR